MKKHNKLVCRPCKEQNNWEIEMLNGEVSPEHYATQNECEREACKLCEEYGCEYVVEKKEESDRK